MSIGLQVKSKAALVGVAVILWIGTAFATSSGSAIAPPLKVTIKRVRAAYVLEVRNTSDKVLSLTPLRLGGPAFSGLSLYIYDPSSGSLGEAMSTVFPGSRGAALKRIALAPGDTLAARFEADEVAKYLAPLPRCYYLVAIYHEVQSGLRVWSAPSNVIRECK